MRDAHRRAKVEEESRKQAEWDSLAAHRKANLGNFIISSLYDYITKTKIKVMDVFQKIGTPVQLASLTFTSQTMIANR